MVAALFVSYLSLLCRCSAARPSLVRVARLSQRASLVCLFLCRYSTRLLYSATLLGCSVALPLGCSTALLLGCSTRLLYSATLLGCSVALPLGCSTARLLYRFTRLLYRSTARLLYSATLLGCSTALLLGYSTRLLYRSAARLLSYSARRPARIPILSVGWVWPPRCSHTLCSTRGVPSLCYHSFVVPRL